MCVSQRLAQQRLSGENRRLNLEDIFSQAEPISAIGKMHFLKVTRDGVVSHVLTKDSTSRNDLETHSRVGAIVVDDWFLVEYEGKQFPGEVIAVHGEEAGEYQVSVMERVGRYWKWPAQKDAIFYMEKMVAKLDAPEVVNNRGHFKFSAEI